MMCTRMFGSSYHLLWTVIPLAGLSLAPLASAAPPVADGLAGGLAGGGCPLALPDEEIAFRLEDILARAEEDSLCVTLEDYPEFGLIVLGLGKGANGEPKGPRSRGLVYCKLGTGYDAEWNITGEKYCYAPGESVVFGGHYEMLYSGRWCGDGWYRPDGSVYDEDQNAYWIPDPSDYGYEYWEWYNVVFAYDPMPGSMQQEEGSWTAKWWDNGSNVCSKNYTVMYNLVDDTTCKDMTPEHDPINRTSTFLVIDQYVYSWVQCDDFSLNFTDDFRWLWYGPEGFYAEIIYDAENPGSGLCWEWYRAWGRIYVDGHYPAEHPGNWYVDVYIKDYTGSWEHKLTHNFTIDCVTSGPVITQQPTPSSATVCEGQSQHWCVTAEGVGTLSYQWQRNTGGGWENIAGATASCHDATVPGSYRCVVSDACGSTNSSTAFLTVRTAPSITQQPDPPLAVVCGGESQIWCVQASGSTPLEYQWQLNTGGGWEDMPGEESSCTQATVDGSYRCLVSNDCGDVYSDTVTLVVAYPPTITGQPDPPAATICEGNEQEWCVSAEGAEPLDYQWERNPGSGWTLIAGATSACYSATEAASYRCGVSNMCGDSVYSDVVALTVDVGPIISEIADHSTLPGEPYSVTPQLLQGTPPVSWTLVEGSADMTVDPATGEVQWPDPTPPDSVHQVVIAAGNACGDDQEDWQLTVEPLPTYTIGGQVFTDLENPMFSGLPGVTVTVDGDGGLFTTETVTSPVPGLWEIAEVPQGQYLVYLEKPGYCFRHFVEGVPGGLPPLSILVNEENQADNQSILFWAVEPIPPDFDCDADVDMDDFEFLVRCTAGPDVTTPPPSCTPEEFDLADLDDDEDVDLSDFAEFQRVFSASAPPVMVLIPGGEFEMGCHVETCGADELPVHTVYVNSFYMDVSEVTSQQYCDYLNSAYAQGLIEVTDGVVYKAGGSEPYCDTTTSSSHSRIHWDGVTFTITAGKEDHPMVKVSWYGAAAYCNRRSAQHGRQPCYDLSTWTCDFSANGYRLPTEAEWEYAARGGLHSPYYKYPWGNDIDGSKANYWVSGDPYEAGGYPWTTPVGYYDGGQTPPGSDMANGYGLYDMAGNVWEWCNDWYSSTYYGSSPCGNPQGPASGTYRVLRGGSWYNVESYVRCAVRYRFAPELRVNYLGFRVASGR